jgi:hypothetical protein
MTSGRSLAGFAGSHPIKEINQELSTRSRGAGHRYPELTDGEGEPRGHLSAFDFVANLGAALRQEPHLAYWTLGGQAARETARRMNAEPNTLKALAELAGEPDVTADRLAELIAERLPAHSHFLGQFPDWRGAVSVLLTGTAQD